MAVLEELENSAFTPSAFQSMRLLILRISATERSLLYYDHGIVSIVYSKWSLFYYGHGVVNGSIVSIVL